LAAVFSLLTGSLIGIAIGSYFSAKMPDRVLRLLLAATLMVVGARLAIEIIRVWSALHRIKAVER